MANIKFSQFTAEADINNFDGIVGYAGANNNRISPADLASSLEPLIGPYLPLAAGVGNPLTGDLYIGDGTAASANMFLQTTRSVAARWPRPFTFSTSRASWPSSARRR